MCLCLQLPRDAVLPQAYVVHLWDAGHVSRMKLVHVSEPAYYLLEEVFGKMAAKHMRKRSVHGRFSKALRSVRTPMECNTGAAFLSWKINTSLHTRQTPM